METSMSAKKQPRDQISPRLDPEVLEVVQRVAEVERRPVSNLVRNIVEDWAKARERQTERSEERVG
jgi:predicted transcriptional regulator